MAYVVLCLDKADSLPLRRRLRATHLRYMIRHRGRILNGGPLLDEAGSPVGSVMALAYDEKREVEAFLADEPYTKGGLFETVVVRRWRQMVPEPVPNALEMELDAEQDPAGPHGNRS